MHYLLATVAASVAFGIGLKISEARERERLVVALANYLCGFVCAGVYWLSPWCANPGVMEVETFWVGCLGGFTWVAGLLTMMVSIRFTGIAVTTAISRLSLVLVIVACVLGWGEVVTPSQWGGMGLALVAVLLLGSRATRREGSITRGGVVLLVLLLLSQAASQLSMKVFESSCPKEQTGAFMVVLFGVAALITGSVILWRRARFVRSDVVFGAVIGIPNLLTGVFLTLALVHLAQDALVYAVTNVAAIALLALAGILFWREKPGRAGIIGLALTVASLILLQQR